jgi:SAM-dependent methyltransferase
MRTNRNARRNEGPWPNSTAGEHNGHISEIAKYWDEQAATFDDAPDHGLRDPAIRSAWTSLLIPLLPPAPARVADLGCGTGTLAVLVGGAGYRVSGIDLAPGMVKRARAKALEARVDADFEVADAMTPPWPKGTFDVVLARHVLWALPDAGLGLDRWLELLKPDGRLVLIEGQWWTGGGLPSEEALTLVRARNRDAAVTPLDEPTYWGAPISDERYVLVTPPSSST